MKTMFGFFSTAFAGAAAQSIAAAANSGQTAVLNLRFTILYPFIRDSPDAGKPASMFAFSGLYVAGGQPCVSRSEHFLHDSIDKPFVLAIELRGLWRHVPVVHLVGCRAEHRVHAKRLIPI